MDESAKPICDQAFFLALAKRGQETWNKWRDENPQIPITLEEVNFQEPENATIDFSGFNFGDHADFSRCRFARPVVPQMYTPEMYAPEILRQLRPELYTPDIARQFRPGM